MTRAPLLLVVGALGALAAPPSKQVLECVQASEAAQAARDELRYDAARATLARCTAPACPAVIQTDCAKWLSQLELDQPSLVIVATRTDGDVTEGFAVSVDGRAVPNFRPGQPLKVDPGARAVTVTLLDGRALSEKLVVNVGERNRRVVFAFPTLVPAGEKNDKKDAVGGLEVRSPPARAPVVPLLLTGGTVAAAATFTVLGVLGNGALAPVLSSPCAETRTCNPTLVQPARDLYLGADIALGTGIVLAILATWQWIAWASSP